MFDFMLDMCSNIFGWLSQKKKKNVECGTKQGIYILT